MYWKKKKILLLADAHLSKETHFRKNGIAVPAGILASEMEKLDMLIDTFNPHSLLFLGDLFHSDMNRGMHEFSAWRSRQKNLDILLVRGNHDILPDQWYGANGIELYEDFLQLDDFIFSHQRKAVFDGEYNVSGHVHPCVVMHGAARQSLRLPCFVFGRTHGLLPAFGKFTGTKSVLPDRSERIYAIADNEILNLQ